MRTFGINARNFFVGLADAIRRLVARTDMFTSDEVAIAAELVQERVSHGRISGYEFIIGESDGGQSDGRESDGGQSVGDERDGTIIAYACYGPVPGTEDRYDLYWIAVDRDLQGKGAGRQTHVRVENAVRQAGGRRIYAETSSRDQYAPTRRFYRRLGYRKVAELHDFYREGDGKVIYMKELV